jgi:hypothetical protein
MMEECEQFRGHPNAYKICRGESNLPKYKTDRYRAIWGLKPLFGVVLPEQARLNPTVVYPDRDPYKHIGFGPGAELLKIYKQAGIPACEDCFKLAKQMNQWGPDVCLEKMDEIIADVMPRAKKWLAENKPWIHALLPNVVEEAGIRLKVKADLEAAVARSRLAKPAKTEMKIPKGRCCGS